ncbi:MAG TPA: 16S rRNA (cytosine(1402)-N(4))-methyltransferase, partial [Gammaproteobacteria bacterium]|nr:16S rRNA (cytosine(1402)-N(4))-methyltransferase [Gammaproteobacteria bacterium]
MSDHRPVLVDEVLEGLGLVGNGRYVDATYGRGGHSTAILAALGNEGAVLALDKDPAAVAA